MAESAYPKKTIRIFSLLLIVTAKHFYWVWVKSYARWKMFTAENIGVYTIFIVLFGFGILGYLLTRFKK